MRRLRRSLSVLTLLLAGATGRAGAAAAVGLEASPSSPGPAGRSAKPARASTLDLDLQRVAERLLRGAKPVEGAIVAIDPKTGKVLTFSAIGSSGSSFDVLTRA